MKKYDVIALGELLIDFTSSGTSEQGNSLFEANPGGAVCNVLAMLNQLGHKTAFIGKVGEDIFGRRLKRVLDEVGIGTEVALTIRACVLRYLHFFRRTPSRQPEQEIPSLEVVCTLCWREGFGI